MADKYGLFFGLVVSVEQKGLPSPGRCPLTDTSQHDRVSGSRLILCKDAQPVTEIPSVGARVQRHFHSCFNAASIGSSDSGDPER